VDDSDQDRLVAITNTGHMLVFPVAELPQLPRGKGNKILAIPAAKAAARDEVLCALAVVPPGAGLTILSGKRHFTLRPADLDAYQGERGRRGHLLPRGFQRVDGVTVG
jgi:topoisomerase-4 subunit A